MEDNESLIFKNICNECGLPMKIHSFEIVQYNNSNYPIVKLFCQNLKHKTIIKISFEEYQSIFDESLENVCKCTLCNKFILEKSIIPNYCYTCKKIICSDCINNNKHEKEHQNIFNYNELNKKCLIHSNGKNDADFYCPICKNNYCQECIEKEEFDHAKEHTFKEIELSKEVKENIKKINNINSLQIIKKEKLLKELKRLNTLINFYDFLVKEKNKNIHLLNDYKENSNIININNENEKYFDIEDYINKENIKEMDKVKNNKNEEKKEKKIENKEKIEKKIEENKQNEIKEEAKIEKNIEENKQNEIKEEEKIEKGNEKSNENNNENNKENKEVKEVDNKLDNNINIDNKIEIKEKDKEINKENNNKNNNMNKIKNAEDDTINNKEKQNNQEYNKIINKDNPANNKKEIKEEKKEDNREDNKEDNRKDNNEDNRKDNNEDNNEDNKENLIGEANKENNKEINKEDNHEKHKEDNNKIEHKKKNKENNINNKNRNGINIIYYDDNVNKPGMDIINDCCNLTMYTNGSIILVNDMNNLDLLLKYLKKNYPNNKCFFMINGGSSNEVISFIKKNNYNSLFINACIYTRDIKKYSSMKQKYPDFIGVIEEDIDKITKFIIKEQFENINNGKIYINSLINYFFYENDFFPLHKQLSLFYGNEEENLFNSYFSSIRDYITNENLNLSNDEKDNLINCFQIFSELQNKDYEKIITCYLKDYNFSNFLNSLLIEKDLKVFTKIGYFVGNLMHCIVEYGKKGGKGIDSGFTFYKGMELSIIDLLEYLKNRNYNITFPYFFTMSDKKEFAEFTSKRNKSEKKRKSQELYSVIMKIEYLYDDGYEPCIYNLIDLCQYPDEEEYFLLPFTFLNLKNITIDSKKLTADIKLQVIGKKYILEKDIKEGKSIEFDKNNVIMISK